MISTGGKEKAEVNKMIEGALRKQIAKENCEQKLKEESMKCCECKFFLWYGWQGYMCSVKGCWEYSKFQKYEIKEKENKND